MSLIITHNAGFFSCCSVRLDRIINYINTNKKLPNHVDTSESFSWYKIDKTGDITYDYFERPNNLEDIIIDENTLINYEQYNQFSNYSELDYKNICNIVKKYFTPSQDINNIIKNLETKYNLNYDNICVLFYRGNDKNRETKICGYNEYIKYANIVIHKNPEINFLIQSDETQFIELMTRTFPNNSFYFKDEIRHMNKCDNTVDKTMKDKNYIFSRYYLGITIVMSKCKYIICGSGNCSIWIMLYRENNINVYQNRNGRWIEPTQ